MLGWHNPTSCGGTNKQEAKHLFHEALASLQGLACRKPTQFVSLLAANNIAEINWIPDGVVLDPIWTS
eukprot:1145968-Pelagomonas_calceolata.AAC.2